MEPDIHEIRRAQALLSGIITPSPLVHSGYFSRLFGADVFLKLENLQETGSFKVRGAYYRLLHLTEGEKKKGVIAASAGNHAQGVVWAANRLGIKSTIVMPKNAPLRKQLAVRDYGAEIILFGAHYSDARNHAFKISKKTGMILIPGFDNPYIIAGQGTIGLEISKYLEGDVAVMVPIGGGGLIAGVGTAIKALNPAARVIGVQSKSCPSVIRSLSAGRIVSVDVGPTIADGIAVNQPGKLDFSIIQKVVDEVVEVEEEAIAEAVLSLLEKANIIAEGAGAIPMAALTENGISAGAKRYVLIISGGNIDVNIVDRILHRGALRMGRTFQVEVNIPDIPGSLYHLLGIIAREKANILQILHDRLDLENPIQFSRVKLSLETRGHEHAEEILESLQKAGYSVRPVR